MVANAAPYSSKIIRAGALLPDTKLLLAHWDLSIMLRPIYAVSSRRTSSAKPRGLASPRYWRSLSNAI